jgi:hypothetical protein
MKILFDGYLMKRGNPAAGKINNHGFTGNLTDFAADSYLMVI